MDTQGAIQDIQDENREVLRLPHESGSLNWFAAEADNFGSVLLESSLEAYGRGGKTFAAVSPVDSWVLESDERIPVEWKKSLDLFLSDSTAFYAMFFSYEFGAELVAGNLAECNGCNDIATGFKPEFKALVLKYSDVQIYSGLTFDSSKSLIGSGLGRTSRRAKLLSSPDRSGYLEDVSRIKRHIYEGDIYQANLTAEWSAQSGARPWEIYRRLQELNPCQYGGYANLGEYTVISSTPERLISVSDRTIIANPIKGTIAVGDSEAQTESKRLELLASEKDRAELLMIVDLLRNDLGKICEAGSVATPTLWSPEIYSSLIHLVAEIRGRLRRDVTTADIIDAVFPGGSITGAPKRRAIRILREIEGRKRGIYTGSFGYNYGSELDLNIAIRTLTYLPVDGVCGNGVYFAQAGGGIVADSDAESEYDEACLKVDNLLKAIDPELRP